MRIWNGFFTNTFAKQYKNLDRQMQKRVDKIIRELQYEEYPESSGVYKADMKVYAYEIGRKYRILYSPLYDSKIIEFYRVCDHTSVYMKD